MSHIARFWSKVRRSETSSCWEWQAAVVLPPCLPYGRFKFDGTPIYAHRFCWMTVFGSVPPGLLVLHKCDNAKCVNPFHLYLGTHVNNAQDMVKRGRVKAIRGHYQSGNGESHPLSKLTVEMVKAMRAKYKPGVYGFQRLANEFGVSKPSAMAAIKGDTWSHV